MRFQFLGCAGLLSHATARICGRKIARVLSAALAGVSLLVPPARAVTQDGQVWIPITARVALPSRFRLWLEAQPRIGGDGMRMLLLRPAIGYQVLPNWSVYQGYAWTPTFNSFNSENRIYQESLFDDHWGDLRLVNRTRLEERFIDGVGGTSLRLRNMLRLTHPLDQAHHWYVALSDEPFATLNDTGGGPRSGFDQNRAFLGLRYQLTPNVAIELGYLNQYSNKRAEDVSSHNALLSLDLSLSATSSVSSPASKEASR